MRALYPHLANGHFEPIEHGPPRRLHAVSLPTPALQSSPLNDITVLLLPNKRIELLSDNVYYM